MLSDSDRLLATVEQVLQASRTRESTRALNRTEFDLGELLTEVSERALTRNHLDASTIRTTLPSEPVMVSADREELTTVFSNLLENAIKYSPDGPRISIRVAVRCGSSISL